MRRNIIYWQRFLSWTYLSNKKHYPYCWKKQKHKKKIETFSELYSRIAHNDLFLGNINHAKLALDSASMFLSKTTDNNTIALYHYASGDYYNLMLDETNAHRSYYEAIRSYEQSKENYLRVIYIA